MNLRVWLIDLPERIDALAPVAEALPSDWIVERTTEPQALFDSAEVKGFDAVICGSGIDDSHGIAVLERVQDMHPEALRVLALAPSLDEATVSRLSAAPVVQQAILAPFDVGHVRALMRRVLTVRGLLRHRDLREALGTVQRLPSSPTTFMALRMAMADEHSSVAGIGKTLSRDPGLAARVLRVANSAMYARGRGINDVAAAVTRLGLGTISQLVLASEVFGGFAQGADGAKLERQALLASALAQRLTHDVRDSHTAASAALLADIGMLLPGSVLNAPPFPGEAWQGFPRVALLGAGLMAIWGLPMEMVEAVAYRHLPSRLRLKEFNAVGRVHVACALAAGTDVDLAYLDACGLLERLEGWQALRDALAEQLD